MSGDTYNQGYVDTLNWVIEEIFHFHEHFPEEIPGWAKEDTSRIVRPGEPFILSLPFEVAVKDRRDLFSGGQYEGKEWYEH